MTDAELTKMLRSSANRVVNYAADRIEALTAELSSGSFYKEADIDRLQDRAEAAEEENARLRAALTALHKQALMLRGEQSYREFARAVEKQARAALKGDTHE